MMPPHEIWRLGTQRVGKTVWFFPRLDSTNTAALSLAKDVANDGLVLLAHEQTQGRGQYSRSWTAPPGSSVLVSVLLFPPAALRRPALLTAWAAVSACETIEEVAGLEATIKWPNDVLVQGKKVCGILIEQRNTGLADSPLAAAIGIGLNVRQSADFFARANFPRAASLASLSGRALATRRVAERLIQQLDVAMSRLVEGDAATLEALWKERLGLLGKKVVVETAQEKKEGKLLEVTWEGILLEESGQRGGSPSVLIAPEMVRHMNESAT